MFKPYSFDPNRCRKIAKTSKKEIVVSHAKGEHRTTHPPASTFRFYTGDEDLVTLLTCKEVLTDWRSHRLVATISLADKMVLATELTGCLDHINLYSINEIP